MWGRAKALVQAMQERGIDLADEAGVEGFIEQANRGEVGVRL